MNNNSLQQEAERRDVERQQTDKAAAMKAKKLRDYKRNVAKLNAMMIRTEETFDPYFDNIRIEQAMAFFKK